MIGNLSCGCGEEQAPGKSFLVRVSNQSCECIYHAKFMPLLRLHARELVSVEPAAWGWEIESFPYPFQSAGDDALFQLSIGSAVFFFPLFFSSSLFGAGNGTQGLVYWIHLLYH